MAPTTTVENYNAGTSVLATVWALTATAVVVMAFRVLAKIKISNFNIDDVAMIIALVLLISSATSVTMAIQAGLARKSIVTHEQEVRSITFYTVALSTCIISCTVGRIAFIMYLRRLLPVPSKTRSVLLLLLGLQPPVNVVSIFLMFFQCTNIAAVFDPTMTQESCMSMNIQLFYGYFQGAFNTATDIYLATFPIWSFWNLQLRLRIKIVLLCLLSMGLFAGIACMVKTVSLRSITVPGNFTIVQAQLLHWAYIEAGLVVITSSIPCLRPLFVGMAKNFSSSPGPTYELTPTYGHSHDQTTSYITSRAHTYPCEDANDGWRDGDSAREILEETRGGIMKQTTVTMQTEDLST